MLSTTLLQVLGAHRRIKGMQSERGTGHAQYPPPARWQWLLMLLCLCSSYAPVAAAQSTINTQEYEVVAGNFGGNNTSVLFVARDPSRPSGIVELGLARADGALFTQSWPSNFLGLDWSPERYNFIAADVNGDRRSDLILQSKAAGDHHVLLSQPVGGFDAIHQTIPNYAYGLDWSGARHRLVAGDYNGDGRDDLFFQATAASGTNAILLADASTGLFTASSSTCWSDGPHLCWSDSATGFQGLKWSLSNALVYAGDFNGDGKDDFVVQAKPTIALVDYDSSIPVPVFEPFRNGIVLSQSSGSTLQFSVGQYYDRFSLGVDWSPDRTQLVIVRLGNDAFDDIIFQSRRTGEPSYILRSNGNGTLAAAEALPNQLPGPDGVLTPLNFAADAVRILPGFFNPERLTPGLALIATTPAGTSRVMTQFGGAGSGDGYFVIPTSFTGSGGVPTGPPPGDVVGAIAGRAEVSVAGEATYTIALDLPPGINGLTPRLSLNYRHNAGGGLLGRHWDVGGLSQIDRCPATLGQDGMAGTVNYVAADRYCLDGNKLKLVSGAPGSANAIYRTEVETYSRIKV